MSIEEIKARHEFYIPYKAADPSNHVLTQLLTTLTLMHKDRGKLLKMVAELQAQLKDREMLYEAGITAARGDIAKLEAQLAELNSPVVLSEWQEQQVRIAELEAQLVTKEQALIRAANRCVKAEGEVKSLQSQVDSNLALVTCGACGSETATSNELLVNKRIAELEAQLDEVIKGHLETGKVTHKRIAELAAQLERINMCAAVRLDDCPDMSRLEYVVKLSDIEAAIKGEQS